VAGAFEFVPGINYSNQGGGGGGEAGNTTNLQLPPKQHRYGTVAAMQQFPQLHHNFTRQQQVSIWQQQAKNLRTTNFRYAMSVQVSFGTFGENEG